MEGTAELTLEQQLQAEKEKNAQLEQDLTTAREEQGKAEQELADANQLIEDLNAQLAEKPKANTNPVVTLGVAKNARKFEVLVPTFRFKGAVVKRSDVKSNSDLLKQLVEAGAGVLKEVTEAAQ